MTRLPIVIPLKDVTFEAAVRSLSEEPWFACIDARGAHPRAGRYSIVAANPLHTFTLAGAFVTADGHTTIDTPHTALLRFCARVRAMAFDPYLPFSGGILGYVGFEGARALRGFAPAPGFTRLPQLRFGIYGSALVFDHAEGAAFIVANGDSIEEAVREAEVIQERLAKPLPQGLYERATAFGQSDLRLTPDECEFMRIVDAARSWVRAESAGRIHLARHSVVPQYGLTPVELFLGGGSRGTVRAMFTHEGAAYIASSYDALLNIRDRQLRSAIDPGQSPSAEIARELGELCEGFDMPVAESDPLGVSFTGRLRRELAPIDALIGLMPSRAMTGSPYDRAMDFIERHEGAHRTLYGGAFGSIDANTLSFWSAKGVQTVADGTIATTSGADITADTDSKGFLQDFSTSLRLSLQRAQVS